MVKSLTLLVFIVGFVTPSFALWNSDVAVPSLKKQVMERMLKDFPFLDPDDVSIEFKEQGPYLPLSKEKLGFKAELEGIRHLLGETILNIHIKNSEDETIEIRKAQSEVKALGPFVTLVNPLKKGSEIEEHDLKVVKIWLRGNPLHAIRKVEDAIGMESIAFLAADQILTKSMIRPIPSVRNGNSIGILMSNNNVKIKVKGMALEDGAIGESIKVRVSVGQRKVLKGVVLDSNTVEISSYN